MEDTAPCTRCYLLLNGPQGARRAEISIQISAMAGFESWTSHLAVQHATARPPPHTPNMASMNRSGEILHHHSFHIPSFVRYPTPRAYLSFVGPLQGIITF